MGQHYFSLHVSKMYSMWMQKEKNEQQWYTSLYYPYMDPGGYINLKFKAP